VNKANTLRRILLLIAFAISGLSLSAQDRYERITLFDVEVDIEQSGDILVTEKITVNAQGNEIKRGILRELPRKRKNAKGQSIPVDYEVLSVKRDGNTENYVRERNGSDDVLRIGRREHFLEHGLHTYEISYRYKWQIGYFEDYDELYWNITGNDWRLAIDKVTAKFNLPSGASVIQSSCYTGGYRSTGSDCTIDESGA